MASLAEPEKRILAVLATLGDVPLQADHLPTLTGIPDVASALETPGGLKVQTIHAFCTRLLHQFPFEANVGARFTVLDGAATMQLLDSLTLEVLLEASARPDSALGKALAAAIVAAGAGAGAMNAIGTAVTGGMLSATFIDLIFIPLFFVVVTNLFGKKSSQAAAS